MYEENIARYTQMLHDFTEEYESFLMAIIMRDGEALTIRETVERLGYAPSLLRGSSAESCVDIDDVTLVQVNDGVLLMGDPYRIGLMDRLGGTGYRYWRLS